MARRKKRKRSRRPRRRNRLWRRRKLRKSSRRRRKKTRNRSRKKWIKGAIKRPGALRKKFARWYGLKPDQKIPASMYAKGHKRAKRTGDTRTMRQINLAKTLGGMRRRKRKPRIVYGRFRRRKAA